MKIKLVTLFLSTAFVVTAVSCKGEKKNETDASDAEEVIKAPAAAVAYNVNPASSMVSWTGKKPTGAHTGTIKVSDGSLKVQDGNIQGGSFTIDMTSVNVTDLEGEDKAKLEGHLKGDAKEGEDHFFNTAKFPKAFFEITDISEKEGKTMLNGNLIIKDIKKNISFPVMATMTDNGMTLTSETFTINRTDWGVNYGSKSVFDDLGDKFINDDVELKIDITAKKA